MAESRGRSSQRSTSALAEDLVEEGLPIRRHPMIVFCDGASGRRAGLIGGPDVWEVVGGLVSGDVPPQDRMSRAAEHQGLTRLLESPPETEHDWVHWLQ